MKSLIIVILTTIVSSTYGFSQEQERPTSNRCIIELLRENVTPGESRTVSIELFETPPEYIISLRDEFSVLYSEWVYNVVYDQDNSVFSFTYTSGMDKEQLIGLFKKYHMSNLLNQKEHIQ